MPPPTRPLSVAAARLVRPGGQFVDQLIGKVPAKIGVDDTWMHRERQHAAPTTPPCKLTGEEGICRLRSAVGHPWRVLRGLEIGVDKVDVAARMAPRAQRHHTRRRASEQGGIQQRREQEVTKMVRSELGLEAFHRAAEWARHDPCVVHEHVDCVVGCQVGVGKVAYRGQVGEVDHPGLNSCCGNERLDVLCGASRGSPLRASTVTEAP